MSILGEAIGRIANDLVHREKFKRPIVMCAVSANFCVDANGRSAHAIMDEQGVRTAIEDPPGKKFALGESKA
jgi:hypothetical protein